MPCIIPLPGADRHSDDFLGKQVDIPSALVQMVTGCYCLEYLAIYLVERQLGSGISDVLERTLMYVRATLFCLILQSLVSTMYECGVLWCFSAITAFH